jgi:hypothetical protein
VNDWSSSVYIGIRDVAASWFVCLAIVLLGFVLLGGSTHAPQEEWAAAPSAAVTGQQIFSAGANKASSPTVSMAVRHC